MRERDLTGVIPASPFGNPSVDVPAPGNAFGDVIDQPQEAYCSGQRVLAALRRSQPEHRSAPRVDLPRRSARPREPAAGRGCTTRWRLVNDDHLRKPRPLHQRAYLVGHPAVGTPPGRYRITYSATGRGLGSTFPINGATREFATRHRDRARGPRLQEVEFSAESDSFTARSRDILPLEGFASPATGR